MDLIMPQQYGMDHPIIKTPGPWLVVGSFFAIADAVMTQINPQAIQAIVHRGPIVSFDMGHQSFEGLPILTTSEMLAIADNLGHDCISFHYDPHWRDFGDYVVSLARYGMRRLIGREYDPFGAWWHIIASKTDDDAGEEHGRFS